MDEARYPRLARAHEAAKLAPLVEAEEGWAGDVVDTGRPEVVVFGSLAALERLASELSETEDDA
jgi:hypothetical protein